MTLALAVCDLGFIIRTLLHNCYY